MIRAADALHKAALVLAEAGIEAPRREARLLVGHLTGGGVRRPFDPEALVDEERLAGVVGRRAAHEPLAFITSGRGFWTLDLAVSPATLIPRADTETLVEAALAAFPARDAVRRVLDLGTGTGCLLLACLAEFPGAWGLGVDVVPEAAALARRNAIACGMAARSAIVAASWTDPILVAGAARFDLILSNPPYIPSGDIEGLMPEVACHEPVAALDGGADGLAAYRAILPRLPALLAPGGVAILEIGIGQEDGVAGLAREAGFSQVSAAPDLAGTIRALTLSG